jgi:ATP diphosphatase
MLPNIKPLVDIMAHLRDPETGCPWDIAQNFDTIAPYTIEEAYEVGDAISRMDMAALRDELGDLLLQVVFHSRMAEEGGYFDLGDVITSICDKMLRRHPHVFEDSASPGWEEIKAGERQQAGAAGVLDGIALSLPALMRAQKIQRRAARTGFDWPDVTGVRDKLAEELVELAEAETPAHVEEEAGDLLFAAVNLVRHYGVDAEHALRKANDKFERRFRAMEQSAGDSFAALPLEEKEELWLAAKQTDAKASRSA